MIRYWYLTISDVTLSHPNHVRTPYCKLRRRAIFHEDKCIDTLQQDTIISKSPYNVIGCPRCIMHKVCTYHPISHDPNYSLGSCSNYLWQLYLLENQLHLKLTSLLAEYFQTIWPIFKQLHPKLHSAIKLFKHQLLCEIRFLLLILWIYWDTGTCFIVILEIKKTYKSNSLWNVNLR